MNFSSATSKTEALFAVAASILLLSCASQQDIATLDHRLSKMEQRARELQQQNLALKKKADDLSSQVEKGEADRGEDELTLRAQTASVYASQERLEEQLQRLTGRVEETDHALREATDGIADQGEQRSAKILSVQATANLNGDRIARIEEYLGFEASEGLDLPVTDDTLDNDTLSDKERYDAAKRAFDRGDYSGARKGFQRLLTQFPASDNADNAQFWIGETFYREKWYEKAILEYQKVIEKYPKGNKVPASLLKQGLAFSNLRDKANARLILKELTKRFPKSHESGIAVKKLRELN